MKIDLFSYDKVVRFFLPKDVSGSFSFDQDPKEDSKLINVEARDSQWVLYSTYDSIVFNGNASVSDTVLLPNMFYILRRNEQNYLIYVSELSDTSFDTYIFNGALNLLIGNNENCNVRYNCAYVGELNIKVSSTENGLILEKNNDQYVYINDIPMIGNKVSLKNGDTLNVYGLKIIFLTNMLIINNPGNRLTIREDAGIRKHFIGAGDEPQELDIKDVELYKKEDYFSKSPRIRRMIEPKVINLSQAPKPQSSNGLPAILTIGPMFTMALMSMTTVASSVSQLLSGQADLSVMWPSLLMSGSMVVSMLVWPLLTNHYNKKAQKKANELLVTKYKEYLYSIDQDLEQEEKLQRSIILENLISVENCLNIIQNKSMNFWDKRIDQSDFLDVRIGKGNEKLKVKIEFPKEGFTIEENELRNQAEQMIKKYQYINDVPICYSLYKNKLTAVLGNRIKSVNFVNNILLQLITFYSYEDLKIVVFTNEESSCNWNYIKYLNHNFTNSKEFRWYSETIESSKTVAEMLNIEVNSRIPKENHRDEKAIKKPYYVIIIDDYDRVKRYDCIKTISEIDANIGFSMIIIEDRLSNLPSKCNNFISLGEKTSGILKNSYEKQEQITFYDEINYGINMMNVAKRLSNVPIELEEAMSQLPDAVTFLEMEKVGKVEQLNVLNRWNTNDSTATLKAEVGVDASGDLMYLDLHEKFHGPHGLIAGMTGSGKSEFIITYILSMAMNYSPDDVAFILIDYKGGGLAFAFENKTQNIILPHLAGTITNLDKAEMARTLVSIDSEVKRRQRIFNYARDTLGESTIDIYKYQKYFKEGKLTEPVPHLFIICDEFAELKSQQPDFMDNLISVARIGRSLGVHLILATQKPSGVVNDQIWSNTKFRVCLKVQDESDSKEMLKRPEAASLKQTGRFYLQVGFDEYFALGQSGWCGAKYYPSDKIQKQIDKSVNFINDCGANIKSIQEASSIKIEAQGEQLAAIMNTIIEVAKKTDKKARKLWLDNIPDIIYEDYLLNKYKVSSTEFDVEAIIGEYDAPENQEQGVVKYNLLTHGNTLVYGNNGSENEMLLNSIIYSASRGHKTDEVNFYLVDYGSETLRRFQNLPHVGGIVVAGENERFVNLLKMVKEELIIRKKLFTEFGGEYKNFIKNSNKKLPVMVVVLNNYDSISESYPDLYDEMPDLLRDSERYGIVFILTGSAINSVSSKISQNFTNIYAFKLKDSSDYSSIFDSRVRMAPRDILGRGLVKNGGVHEFQTISLAEEDNLNDFILSFVNGQKEKNPTKARAIPALPEIVRQSDVIKGEVSLDAVPIGIGASDLAIYKKDYLANIFNIITSNKLAGTVNFVKSLIEELKLIPNNNLIVMDPLKQLYVEGGICKNYYTENLPDATNALVAGIQKLIDTKATNTAVILIHGLDKYMSKIMDPGIIENLMNLMKQFEKASLIIVEDTNKMKNYNYESWFANFDCSEGVWIGRGISEQSLLRLSTVTREMSENCPNNIGYFVTEGVGMKCKLIDFFSSEKEDENE